MGTNNQTLDLFTVGSNPTAPALLKVEGMHEDLPGYVTPVTWLEAPELLSLAWARRLSGLSEAELVALVESGDLEAQETEAGLLIEKASLSEFVSILVDLRLIADAEADAEAE